MYKILSNNSERFSSLMFNLKLLNDLKITLGNKSIELACLQIPDSNIVYILEKHNPYGLHPLRSGYLQHVLNQYNLDIQSSKLAVIVEDVLGSSLLYSTASSLNNFEIEETEISPTDVSYLLSDSDSAYLEMICCKKDV